MKILKGSALAAFLISACGSALAGPTMVGDYVESRTCNVYIGACHANGERVTAGREAILAWHVTRGSNSGVTLDGLNAVAVVAGKENLGATDCARQSVIYVCSQASAAQRDALVSALKEKYASSLGQVAAVKQAPIEFNKSGLQTTVRVPNTAFVKTEKMNGDCCVMPHMTWYEPFIGLKDKAIAKSTMNEFKGAPELPTRWTRRDENSGYVGEFSF